MPVSVQTSPGLLSLAGDYLHRLSGWAIGRVSRYGIAAGLLVVGILLLAVSVGIATAAGFHFLELRYDVWTAYAIVGGGFFAMALILCLAAAMILRRKTPSIPRPPSAKAVFRQVVPVSMATRFVARNASRGDGRSFILATGAAALLVAWIVVSFKSD